VKLALALAAPGGGESTTTVASADRIRAGPFGRRGGASRQPHDAKLIRDAQRGSEEAIERLFRMHWPRAWRAAYLVVHDAPAAEDIAQEAFLSAIRALERFDRRRPFGPWLHRIVVNRAIDFTRARKLRGEVSEREVAEPAVEVRAAYSDDVVAALASLSVESRAVVVMRYVLEYTPGEIARALDLPRGTVNSRLRRALDHLGEQLSEDLR
jgi:RNA polymerase sigma-70 factor (ECF subfamily)